MLSPVTSKLRGSVIFVAAPSVRNIFLNASSVGEWPVTRKLAMTTDARNVPAFVTRTNKTMRPDFLYPPQ
jgi:hypothetical protein